LHVDYASANTTFVSGSNDAVLILLNDADRMPVRKIKGSWWVDITWKHERLRRRSPLNTKAGAAAFEATLRQEFTRHKDINSFVEAERAAVLSSKKTVVTFAHFAERWMREYVVTNNKPSEQSAKQLTLRKHLLPKFGRLPLQDITTAAIENYKAEKRDIALAPKTINNHLAILGRCLRTALEWEVIDRVPLIKPLKSPPPPFHYLKREELARLEAAAPRGLWRAMIVTAAGTGLRFSELVALEWQDIDIERAVLVVRRANVCGWLGSPKSNRTRSVYLTSEVLNQLATLERNGPLVFSIGGKWIRHEMARLQLRAACRSAGLETAGWHDLRHTFASHLAQAGAPITAIKELLGHSTITMTMRYSHADEESLRGAVALLSSTTEKVRAACRQPEPSEVRSTGHPLEPHGSSDGSTQQKTPAFASVF
jgi:integrase